MTIVEDEQLALTAHKLLGAVSLIAGKAQFLRAHRDDVDAEVCDEWLTDIEVSAQLIAKQLGFIARGLPADLAL